MTNAIDALVETAQRMGELGLASGAEAAREWQTAQAGSRGGRMLSMDDLRHWMASRSSTREGLARGRAFMREKCSRENVPMPPYVDQPQFTEEAAMAFLEGVPARDMPAL